MADQPNSASDAFRQAVVEYLEAVDAGAVLDRQEFLARHSDVRDELQEFLQNQDEVAKAAAEPLAPADASAVEPTLYFGLDSQADAPAAEGNDPLNRSAGRPKRERVGYFGDYELLSEIARGGMGVVYKARQANLDRVVALKMILAGQLASQDDVRRFYQEAEAAANLEHPGIVPIFEVGQYQGQHFFSMAFVDGPSLARLVADGPLPPKEAAAIVKHLAEAMAYAHSKGVVHRDLKPANVLLAHVEGRPGGSVHAVTIAGRPEHPDRVGVYEPKITDFGLAKRTEGDSELTGTGQILGTPAYMPPEQASAQLKQVGPAADVYALGAILYCLLTGRPPFQAASVMDTLMQVLEKEPLPPRDLDPQVPRDLETIALKCLRKDRQRRYASAQALVDELGRYLKGEPILARPVSRAERATKWVRRHPAVAGLLMLVVLSLVIGTTVSTLFAIKASQRAAAESAAKEFAKMQEGLAKNRERDALAAQASESVQRRRAEGREKEALWHLYVARTFPLSEAWKKQNFGELEKLLQESVPKPGEPDFRGWEWYYLQDQVRQASTTLTGPQPFKGPAAWCRATGKLAIATSDNAIEIRDASGQVVERTLPPIPSRGVRDLDWSPDGASLAVSGGKYVMVWDVASGTLLSQWHASKDQNVKAVAWNPDGKRLASTGHSDGLVNIWDVTEKRLLQTLTRNRGSSVYYMRDLSWHPDGIRLAAAVRYGLCHVWDTQAGKLLWSKNSTTNAFPLEAVAWSPDGKRLAAGHYPDIVLWDEQGEKLATLAGHGGKINLLDWSADGRLLLSGSADHTAKIWDVQTAQEQRSLNMHTSSVLAAVWGPTDDRVLTVADEAKITPLKTAGVATIIKASQGADCSVVWTSNGQQLVGAGEAPRVAFHNASSGELIRQVSAPTGGQASYVRALAWNGAGDRLVSLMYHGAAAIWDADVQRPLRLLSTKHTPTGGSQAAAWSPDGSLLAIGNYDSGVGASLWNTKSWQPVAALGANRDHCWCLAWNPDGRRLAIGNGSSLSVWDVVEQRKRYIVRLGAVYFGVAWSPDGRFVAATPTTGGIPILRASDGHVVFTARGHQGPATAVQWSPDGRRFASSSSDGTVRLWDAATGSLLLTAPCGQIINRLAWSPDGRRLGCVCEDGTRRVLGSAQMEASAEEATHLESGVLAVVPSWEEQQKQFPPAHREDTPDDRFLSLTEPTDAKTIGEAIRLDPLVVKPPPPDTWLVRSSLKNTADRILVLPLHVEGPPAQYYVAKRQLWVERLDANGDIASLSAATVRRGRQYAVGGGVATVPFPAFTRGDSLTSSFLVPTANFPPGFYRVTVELQTPTGDVIDTASADIPLGEAAVAEQRRREEQER